MFTSPPDYTMPAPPLRLQNYDRRDIINLVPPLDLVYDTAYMNKHFTVDKNMEIPIYEDEKGFEYIFLRKIRGMEIKYFTDQVGNLFKWKNNNLIPTNHCMLILFNGPNDMDYWDYNLTKTIEYNQWISHEICYETPWKWIFHR